MASDLVKFQILILDRAQKLAKWLPKFMLNHNASFLPRRVYSEWDIVVSLLVRPSVCVYISTEHFLISNDIFGFFESSHQ